MNREETIEAIKVMQAFVDKKRVRTSFGQELDPQGHCYPDWNWEKGLDQYVIAPEPIERWINIFPDKSGSRVFKTKEAAINDIFDSFKESAKTIKLVEAE